jgi:hypothetical protein
MNEEVLIEFIDHRGKINSLDRFVGCAQNSLRHDKPPQRNHLPRRSSNEYGSNEH